MTSFGITRQFGFIRRVCLVAVNRLITVLG